MKVLKCILSVYLGAIIVFLLGGFICFPVILSEYFNDEKYLFLFFINIPVFLGILFHYQESSYESDRPKR